MFAEAQRTSISSLLKCPIVSSTTFLASSSLHKSAIICNGWIQEQRCKGIITTIMKDLMSQGVCQIFFTNFKVFKGFFSIFWLFFKVFGEIFDYFQGSSKNPIRMFISIYTSSENFQMNTKIRRFFDNNWVISHNVVLISTRTNKTKC